MSSLKKHRTRAAAKGSPVGKFPGDIHRYFTAKEASSGTKAAAARGTTRGGRRKTQTPDTEAPGPESPVVPDCSRDSSVDPPRAEMSSPHRPEAVDLGQDIREMLQALPTQTAIEALILRLEETHRRDIQEVRGEVSTLADRVGAGENSLSSLESRVSDLERSRDQHRDTAIALQLHLEDIEDRSRRNNLRLRGVPESLMDVGAAVTEVFRTVLEDPAAEVILDRAHRAPGPKSVDPDRPRDVICRLHRYAQKEEILRASWDHGDVEKGDARIRILPDLSRATLRRRALLRPVLEIAKQKDVSYRWGYPFSVTFRRESGSFTLQTATDLPALFRFLEVAPVQVPDWLQILPRQMGRPGPAAQQGPLPPRRQRGRRRRRSASGGELRE